MRSVPSEATRRAGCFDATFERLLGKVADVRPAERDQRRRKGVEPVRAERREVDAPLEPGERVDALRRPSHAHRLDLEQEMDRPARPDPAGGLNGVVACQPALLQGAAVDAELGLEGRARRGIWAERAGSELPDQFDSVVPALASAYQAIGFVPLVYGLAAFKATPTLAGMLILQGGKVWYIDRMVLLFEEMKRLDPEYARWEY
jgi:hypothetical protein